MRKLMRKTASGQDENLTKKHRLFGVINLFDIFLVLACVAIVYGAHLFSAPQSAVADSGRLIRFTVELSDHQRQQLVGNPAGFYQQISPGPVVIESTRGVPIGQVVYAYSQPFLQDVPDEAAGVFRRTPVEGREFTYVVVEARADVSDLETTVNQIRILVNQDIYVRSQNFAGRGFITHLEFLD